MILILLLLIDGLFGFAAFVGFSGSLVLGVDLSYIKWEILGMAAFLTSYTTLVIVFKLALLLRGRRRMRSGRVQPSSTRLRKESSESAIVALQ